jgi:hypothetical protein
VFILVFTENFTADDVKIIGFVFSDTQVEAVSVADNLEASTVLSFSITEDINVFNLENVVTQFFATFIENSTILDASIVRGWTTINSNENGGWSDIDTNPNSSWTNISNAQENNWQVIDTE